MAAIINTKRRDRWVWRVRWNSKSQGKAVWRQFQTKELAAGFILTIEHDEAWDRRRNRDGSGRAPRTPEAVIEHITNHIELTDKGCWLWTARITNTGYAALNWNRSDFPIERGGHRVSYIVFRGEIPNGLVMDHLCRNRACVNPDHLEAVTQRENVMRSPIAQAALNAAKTHCPQGHAYTPENTSFYRPTKKSFVGRLCRTCRQGQRNTQKELAS